MPVHVGEVIDQIGMGRFQRKLLWACGASWATDAKEVRLILRFCTGFGVGR